MKIQRTGSSPSVAPAKAARAAGAPAAASASSAHRVLDTADIMGIPESDLTPKVRHALIALLDEVARLREELERSKSRVEYLERLADEDSLIPVSNRRAFVRELSRIISYSERYETPSSVVFFDLNGLKKINDTLGHAAGDAALSHVATVLVNNVRESDVVGRLGGDEFGVILVHADHEMAQAKANELAEKIRSSDFAWEGEPVVLAVAFGIHTFAGGESALTALAAADRAMYAHKKEIGRSPQDES